VTRDWKAWALAAVSDAGASGGAVPQGDGRALRGRGRRAYPQWGEARAFRLRGGGYARSHRQPDGRNQMPVILWLLGVPLTVVILLMLLHVI
jgi:hypothetical protein